MRCASLLTLLIASYLGSPLDSNTHKLIRREGNQSDGIHLLNGLVSIGHGSRSSEGGAESDTQAEAETPEKAEDSDDSDSKHARNRGLLGSILDLLIGKKEKAAKEEAGKAEESGKGANVEADLNNGTNSEEGKSDRSTKLLTAKIGGKPSTPETI
jgi:hypothetical protein